MGAVPKIEVQGLRSIEFVAEGLGFRVLCVRCWVLGFWGLEFRVWSYGQGMVIGIGFWVLGLEFRAPGDIAPIRRIKCKRKLTIN